jgi:DNA integrity scanning protein DisA with diadenylate cyclase activity
MSLTSEILHVNRDFNYEKLIDMKDEQLEAMVKECEINCERIRTDIVKNYESAQPYLIQMRLLKQQLKNTMEKMEAAKTFLSMERNGSLVSSIDLPAIKQTIKDRELRSGPISSNAKFKSPLVANWINKSQKSKILSKK